MTEVLDTNEIRRLGEGIHAALFPMPGPTGRPRYPNPVAVTFGDREVTFLSKRTVQRVGEEVPDIRASIVIVVVGWLSFEADLAIGKDPVIDATDPEAADAAYEIMPLLRAVAGVL